MPIRMKLTRISGTREEVAREVAGVFAGYYGEGGEKVGPSPYVGGSQLLLGNATAQGGVNHLLKTKPLPLGFAQEDGGEIII